MPKMSQNWGNVKNVKSFQKPCLKKVIKTGEMLKMLKMLKVFWEIDPPPLKKKMLKTGEMLKMLKVSRKI